jgi:hypothetical protein
MHFLICGDSFSADTKGWPSKLGARITNRSQRGIGEYKIFQQVYDVEKFDKIIICHTSPWRIHTLYHPIHNSNPQRPDNDFILADLSHHKSTSKDIDNIYSYIKKYTDWDYIKFLYDTFLEKLLQIPNSIHITFHDPDDTSAVKNNYQDVWKKYPGDTNHLNKIGNEIIAKRIQSVL